MLIKVFGIWLNPDNITKLHALSNYTGDKIGTRIMFIESDSKIADSNNHMDISNQHIDIVAEEINKQIKASNE